MCVTRVRPSAYPFFLFLVWPALTKNNFGTQPCHYASSRAKLILFQQLTFYASRVAASSRLLTRFAATQIQQCGWKELQRGASTSKGISIARSGANNHVAIKGHLNIIIDPRSSAASLFIIHAPSALLAAAAQFGP